TERKRRAERSPTTRNQELRFESNEMVTGASSKLPKPLWFERLVFHCGVVLDRRKLHILHLYAVSVALDPEGCCHLLNDPEIREDVSFNSGDRPLAEEVFRLPDDEFDARDQRGARV